ncbi:MAG: hypothetical protein ACKVON_06110 [Beijerinckiaceae bacterium]
MTIDRHHVTALQFPPIPSLTSVAKLFAGGLAGLLIWEIWARVFTKLVLGYPLQPAGLIDALFQHNLGISVPWLVRETLHYIVGIVGYPVAYYVISRSIPKYGLVLDVIVWLTFTAGVAAAALAGRGQGFHLIFLIIVTAMILSRFINPHRDIADALSWGTFTWLNALGIFAPLGGLSFYLLGEGGQLSFMSFAGHVIYGAVAAYIFEKWDQAAHIPAH